MELYFADVIGPDYVEALESRGHQCIVATAAAKTDLSQHLATAEVLIVRSTSVTREMIEAAPRLGLIVRAGAGTDTIDVDAASEYGIYVCNVPGQNAVAVAELTMGLILSIDRRIPHSTIDFQNSVWDKTKYSDASGLKGQTIAILGFGSIGLEVAKRAKSFGLHIHGLHTAARSDETADTLNDLGVSLHESLQELLKVSDIVSLHLPLTDQTERLVDEAFLDQMKQGAMLINTSRGALIDEEAMLKAMTTRGLRLGLDVYNSEPEDGRADWSPRLAAMENFVGTHHIGASTDQARKAIAQGVLLTIAAYETGLPPNCVNVANRPLGECAIAVRHKDEVGVLAAVLSCLRTAGINVQQMRNEIFEGTGPTAAVATIRVSQGPDDSTVQVLQDIPSVIKVDVLTSS